MWSPSQRQSRRIRKVGEWSHDTDLTCKRRQEIDEAGMEEGWREDVGLGAKERGMMEKLETWFILPSQ